MDTRQQLSYFGDDILWIYFSILNIYLEEKEPLIFNGLSVYPCKKCSPSM